MNITNVDKVKLVDWLHEQIRTQTQNDFDEGFVACCKKIIEYIENGRFSELEPLGFLTESSPPGAAMNESEYAAFSEWRRNVKVGKEEKGGNYLDEYCEYLSPISGIQGELILDDNGLRIKEIRKDLSSSLNRQEIGTVEELISRLKEAGLKVTLDNDPG